MTTVSIQEVVSIPADLREALEQWWVQEARHHVSTCPERCDLGVDCALYLTWKRYRDTTTVE